MSSKLKKRKNNSKERKTYDDKLSQELADVIEALTHTGKKTLDLEEFKKIKNICKRSDKYVKEAYNMILEHLEVKHAEVRLSAFHICDEIFRRSHCFREQVIFNLEKVVKLTTGVDLPPPLPASRNLKRVALRTIHEWNAMFGDKYKKLALGYKYLHQVEKIDFNALDIVDAATQARQQEVKRRQDAINGVRVKKVLAEMKDKELDIKVSATSLSNSINLLLPHPDDFFIMDEDEGTEDGAQQVLPTLPARTCRSDDSDSDGGSPDAVLREVGMVNMNHSIQLDFTPSSEAYIVENAENTAIIENVREHAKLISNKYLPTVKAWLEVLSRSTGHEVVQKSLVKLKGELDDVMFKYGCITFSSTNDVSSDSELEEVPELMEAMPSVKTPMTGNSTLWSIFPEEGAVGDPASCHARSAVGKKEPQGELQPCTSSQNAPGSTSEDSGRKQKLLAVAPKLPFDVDLYHWEDDKLPVPTLLSNTTEGHRFWVGSEDCIEELPVPEGAAALRTRVIEFTGKFTPVTHSCRVKLPSGKLCPRRDRFKCPFHGEVVPRDEMGQCTDPKDAMRLQQLAEKRQQEKPDWQDPKLLAEIKKATGIDLKMPEKGKRKKRPKEYPGLTDLKASENTVTRRLERKIFKKSVVRKVAAAMDKIDQRKFRDKFGDQFNYFYNS